MADKHTVSCVVCGYDVKPSRLGLRDDGSFVSVVPREMSLRIDHFGGRGRITVERVPLPVNIAIGLRDMLRARLEQVEAELAAAGIES